MRYETRLAARSVTHVAGLFFYVSHGVVLLCFALPKAAKQDARMNYTIPGGRIERMSARRFEPVEIAMAREYGQETGGSPRDIEILSGVGAPVEHYTGKGDIKRVQRFAGTVFQPCSKPRHDDEILSVDWLRPECWEGAVFSMNKGKQQLVLDLMLGTTQLRRMPDIVKLKVFNFLEATVGFAHP